MQAIGKNADAIEDYRTFLLSGSASAEDVKGAKKELEELLNKN